MDPDPLLPILSPVDMKLATIARNERMTHYFIKSFRAEYVWDPNVREIRDHIIFQIHSKI